jgi:hypothetical protein
MSVQPQFKGDSPVTRLIASMFAVALLAFAPGALQAQDSKASPTKAAVAAIKAGKGEKVCTYKFPGGEKRSWVCKKEEPCCAWDAISYVKCGSTITGCL